MKISQQREVVLEIEQTRLVRKRARTSVAFCRGCERATDFVPLIKAAELFGITRLEMFDFSRSHNCHFQVATEGEIHICLVDLLAAMSRRMKRKTVRLLESVILDDVPVQGSSQ